MAQYDFTSLSSVDFENLVRDLLQQERQVRLETFKTGRDRGIDLRYSSDNGKTLIVQCKHYAGSGFSALLRDLSRKELSKVRRLAPNRYVIATSVALNPDEKDEIVRLFATFGTTTGDVYGRDDLNNLLGIFPIVEERHFKLWLTSIPVMEKVLHSAVFNRTEADIDRIKRRLKYYVQNDSFFRALDILERESYCIIAGIPGIGKTTLAEILLVHYIGKGYEAVSINDDVSEADHVYKKTRKQVFYYDDFLGQTSVEEKLRKNEDQGLLRFIEAVRVTRNKRFILTTREYILNQAKQKYEKLDRSEFDLHRCVISLADYPKLDRAKVLFNHVYFSELPKEYKEALLSGKSYNKIISHQNFNPRIVEWMTDHLAGLSIPPSGYVKHFLANLNDPTRLWEHAFDNQLSAAARHLLLVLASFPRDARFEDVEEAFISFHQRAAERHNLRTDFRDYKRALKEVENNFAQVDIKDYDKIVRFHNPSVRDFLESRLASSPREVSELCESSVFFEQVITLWNVGESLRRGEGDSSGNLRVPEHVSQYREVFAQAMMRNFSTGDYKFRVEEYPEEEIIYVYKRRHMPLEARLQFALSAADALDGNASLERWKDVLYPMFEELTNVLKTKTGDKESLISLLNYLGSGRVREGTGRRLIPTDFLTVAKEFLMQDLRSIDHYKFFINFAKSFGEAITKQDRLNMAANFRRFYPMEVSYYMQEHEDIMNPDSIKEFANELTMVASFFAVDVVEEVEELNDYADNLEEELAELSSRDKRLTKSPPVATVDLTRDDEVDAMFEILLESRPKKKSRVTRQVRTN